MIEPNSVCNEIVGSHDWLPTFLTAAGEPDVVEKLKKGYEANGKTYKVHIDGYDLTPYLSGKAEHHSRPDFMYFSDDGDIVAARYDNWKLVFMEQEKPATLAVWMYPFIALRTPKIFNLRTDPYEVGDVTGNTYYDWILRHEFLFVPVRKMVGEFLQTFEEFPPRMKAASFSLIDVTAKLTSGIGSK